MESRQAIQNFSGSADAFRHALRSSKWKLLLSLTHFKQQAVMPGVNSIKLLTGE